MERPNLISRSQGDSARGQNMLTTVAFWRKNIIEVSIRWFNNDRIRLKLKELSPVVYRVRFLADISLTLS